MRSTDDVYGSLAYDDAPLFRVHLCVSRAFLVIVKQCDKTLYTISNALASAS